MFGQVGLRRRSIRKAVKNMWFVLCCFVLPLDITIFISLMPTVIWEQIKFIYSRKKKDQIIILHRLRFFAFCQHFTISEPLNPKFDDSEIQKIIAWSLKIGIGLSRQLGLQVRPTLSLFSSFEIRLSTNFMSFQKVVQRILKLRNCEWVGRENSKI